MVIPTTNMMPTKCNDKHGNDDDNDNNKHDNDGSPPPSLYRSRVTTDVTFGRGDLSVCPLGVKVPMNVLLLIGGVSPRGPHRDKHQGHFFLGALLCFVDRLREQMRLRLGSEPGMSVIHATGRL